MNAENKYKENLAETESLRPSKTIGIVGSQQLCSDGPCRENAKTFIESRIRRKLLQVEQLQTILAMLPSQMTHEQDCAVYDLIEQVR